MRTSRISIYRQSLIHPVLLRLPVESGTVSLPSKMIHCIPFSSSEHACIFIFFGTSRKMLQFPSMYRVIINYWDTSDQGFSTMISRAHGERNQKVPCIVDSCAMRANRRNGPQNVIKCWSVVSRTVWYAASCKSSFLFSEEERVYIRNWQSTYVSTMWTVRPTSGSFQLRTQLPIRCVTG